MTKQLFAMPMRLLAIFSVMLLVTACVHESTIPLGNDMAEINVSAAPVYGRAGAQRIALANAAKTTIAMGYDKFIVTNSDGWNESTFNSGSYAQANVNTMSGQASGGGFANTMRHPESKLIIKMFHNGDKGAAKAVDAHKIIEMNKDKAIN